MSLLVEKLVGSSGGKVSAKPGGAHWRLVGIVAVWVFLCAVGLCSLWRYAEKPGRPADFNPALPIELRSYRQAGYALLVMTVHPQCPCSRASMNELERLLARSDGRTTALVLFNDFDDEKEVPDPLSLRAKAASIPGVKTVSDRGDVIARRLGAETSGQVFLYDASGDLRFSGGITSARGHEGASAGGDAICSILSGASVELTSAPVFGCSLR